MYKKIMSGVDVCVPLKDWHIEEYLMVFGLEYTSVA